MSTRRLLTALTALILIADASPATTNIFRFVAASVQPTGDLTSRESETVPLGDGTTLIASGRVDAEAADAFGFGLDYEHRFEGRFGLGLTLMRTTHDIDLRGSDTGQIVDDASGAVLIEFSEQFSASAEADMTPLLVGANYHFRSEGDADFYAGAFLGWVMFSDIVLEGVRLALKDDFAYGAAVGVDAGFGDGQLAFSASLRYMIAAATPDEPDAESLDIDPFVLMFGIGYNF
jgi:outer membrane protein W